MSSELRVGAPIAMTVQLGDRQRDQVEFVSKVVAGELFEYRMKPVGPLLHSYRQHEVASQADGGPSIDQRLSSMAGYHHWWARC